MGLLARMKIEQSGAGFDSAGESGTVRFDREPSHGREGSKRFNGVSAPSQVGDDGVPGGDIRFVYVFVEPGCEVVVG